MTCLLPLFLNRDILTLSIKATAVSLHARTEAIHYNEKNNKILDIVMNAWTLQEMQLNRSHFIDSMNRVI
jgi:hypothetical protein